MYNIDFRVVHKAQVFVLIESQNHLLQPILLPQLLLFAKLNR